jgi:hypothetical protein
VTLSAERARDLHGEYVPIAIAFLRRRVLALSDRRLAAIEN